MISSIKHVDSNVYGIDWHIDDDGNTKKTKPKNKPFCVFQGDAVGMSDTRAFVGCPERVSTEHDKPKPFCADHVLENPYVQNMLERYASIDPAAERKRAKAWEKEYFGIWEAEVKAEVDAL